MPARKWTYDETLLAFDLYCKIPFGKIHYRNPDIIKLAEFLGRTPSSVAMKMVNLSSHDPELRKRGIKGLSNGSKLEQIVWDDFRNNGAKLIVRAEELYRESQYHSNDIDSSSNLQEKLDLELLNIPVGINKTTLRKQRIGQIFFRKAVLSSFNNRCCITGITITSLLIASHIKPWAKSDDSTEKANPQNGLCLNALHDKAFDSGLISISEDYKIMVSPKLKEMEIDSKSKELFTDIEGKEIMLPDRFIPEKKFLRYHNEYVFQH